MGQVIFIFLVSVCILSLSLVISAQAFKNSRIKFLVYFNLIMSFISSIVSILSGLWLMYFVIKIDSNYNEFCSTSGGNQKYIADPFLQYEH